MRRFLYAASIAMFLPSAAQAACTAPNSIAKIHNFKSGSFEYVDFWINGPFTGTRWISTPTTGTFEHDASGNIVTVAGNRWKKILFKGVFWTCSPTIVGTLPKPRIKAIKNVAQFEGYVGYVIGRQNGSYLGHTMTIIGSQTRIRLKFS